MFAVSNEDCRMFICRRYFALIDSELINGFERFVENKIYSTVIKYIPLSYSDIKYMSTIEMPSYSR